MEGRGMMSISIPESPSDRLNLILDMAWEIFFARITSGRTNVNKESSMQLHYAAILHDLGDVFSVLPHEAFDIELESHVAGGNADITCSLGEASAVLELKCFRKKSNRAVDTDMYDVLKDLERLVNYPGFDVRRFICLTDNPYYVSGAHTGHAGTVTIRNGTNYPQGTVVSPSWAGRWKENGRDRDLVIGADVTCDWRERNGWYALQIRL